MGNFFNGSYDNRGLVNSLAISDNVIFANNSMAKLYRAAYNYNSAITIPNYVTNAYDMLYSYYYNKPITIDPDGDLDVMNYMVDSYYFNQNLNIPTNATHWRYLVSQGYNYNATIELYAERLDEYNNGSLPVGYYAYGFAYQSGFNGLVNFHHTPVQMGYMFASCYNFNRNIQIPQGTNQNCGSMFYSCNNLNQNIRLPDDCNASQSFTYCNSLDKNIRIPRNSNIYQMFAYCNNFNKPVFVPAFPSNGALPSETYPVYDGQQGQFLFTGCRSFNAPVTFNNQITNLCGTFENCESFDRAIALPTGLKDLSGTFRDCNNLRTGQSIPGGVTSMSGTFMGCRNFNVNQYIPDSVIAMPSTFQGCVSLNQNIQLPASGQYFYATFSGCSNFDQNIQFPAGTLTTAGCFSMTNMTHNIQIPSGTQTTSGMFSSCYYLNQNILIPSTVESMSGMFAACSNLNQNIIIPSGVRDMSTAFDSCTNFKQDVVIPSTVQEFAGAFYATKVTHIDIHSNYIKNFFNWRQFISIANAVDVSGYSPIAIDNPPTYWTNEDLFDPIATITFNRDAIVNIDYRDSYGNQAYRNYSLYDCWNGYQGVNTSWYSAFGMGVNAQRFNKNIPYYNHGDLFINSYDYYNGSISPENMRTWRECFYLDYPNSWYDAYWVQIKFV